MPRTRLNRRQWLQTTAALGLAVGGTGARRLSAEDRPSAVIEIGSRRELFVEDTLIDRLAGEATLRLHHPVPREAAIVHDAAWEGSGSGYHTVFQDGDLYRMYYRGLHMQVTQGKLNLGRHPPFYCYAESDDGIHWKKPALGIVQFEGSKENNIILQGRGTHNFAPFKDGNPECAAEARYKALAGVKSEGGLFAFHSADGAHWQQSGETPVITNGAFDSQNIAFWDATLGKYRAYWRTFTAGVTSQQEWKPGGYRAIRTATSDDFVHWNDEADLTYVDSPPEHLYTNQVAPYYRAPHVLIGLPTRYIDRGWSESMRALPDRENRDLRASANRRYGTAITEALLMASRDGVRFKRWNEAFLRPGIGRPGTWQYGQGYVARHVVETAGSLPGAPRELSLYSTEGHWHGAGGTLRRYTLRLDGFVSASAPMKGGELVTRPLRFSGNRLTLNMATSAAGGVRVEVQDAQGQPLPGYGLADCPPQFGDAIEQTVHWQGGPDVASLAGRPVRLRLELQDADVYALRFIS